MSIDVRAKQYGKVFGDWQFDKLVGSGSGGKTVVFRLKRPHSNWEEISALKVVSIIEENGQLEQYSTFFKTDYENRKKELCKKAEEEVRIMYKMHGSAYIVNYFDYIFYDWKEEHRFGCDLLIRMEFLKNLREQIKKGITYTETEVIQIGKDICKALIGCHKENIIHRDIKPENIFQNSQGDYKLGDFGISRMVSRSKSASTMTGTQAYAAPEQFAQNGAGNYDNRVDIYSLGLVLYELCNQNRLPFAKSNYIREKEIQLRIIGKTLEKPCNASSMLSEVILKACAYKPENRYQSAQEFLEALITVDNTEKKVEDVDRRQLSKYENDLYTTKPVGTEIKKENKESELYMTVPAQALHSKDKVEQQSEKFQKNDREMYEIGNKYFYGEGVEINYKEAVKWYRKAAAQGDNDAQYKLGFCYYDGKGVGRNVIETVKWYRKAAEQGNVNAQYNLGFCYYHGEGVEQSYEEAIKWYRKAAEQGDNDAQYNLGFYYYNGEIVEQNYKEAIKWYREAAEQGNGRCQYALGNCYYLGKGVEQNYKEAVKWYRKAAEQGNKAVQGLLGDCYYYGKGVEQNYEEAIKWYTKSAERGDEDAQYNLGFCYYHGEGVEQSYEEAVKWWIKSAEQGHEWAQYKLGNCYDNGIGVEKNHKEAVKWWIKSAEQGYSGAKNELENYYFEYFGSRGDVKNNRKEILKWWTKSAEQGDAEAQYALGNCYYYGIGVKRNYKEAVKWWAKSGNASAKTALEEYGNINAESALKKYGNVWKRMINKIREI